MKILVTGAAGFIGYHLIKQLLSIGKWEVVGIDNLNDYYDPDLKRARLQDLGLPERTPISYNVAQELSPGFTFLLLDLADEQEVTRLFAREKFEVVVNLGAQAGVRHSLKFPRSYIQSNVAGFLNILEACRENQTQHLIYASSSSVYGLNKKTPFSTSDSVDHPVSLYAASKRSNELMAHTYSHLYGLPTTGLRFFTVYGPFGRPDMAYYLFTQKILSGEPIQVFNYGKMKRDFTYIDDIIDGITGLIDADPPIGKELTDRPDRSAAPFSIYNIGNNKPVELLKFIQILEQLLGKRANLQFEPMQAGDVYETYADISGLQTKIAYTPKTDIQTGLAHFVKWYKSYYN